MKEMTSLSNVTQKLPFIFLEESLKNTSLYNPNYTYSFGKYSCVRTFYFVHLVFNYFIFFSGIGAFVTRILPSRFQWVHAWCGRVYILSMLWSTVSSLLMNNTGLPLANLYNFAMVMVGLTVGWIAILFHINKMNASAMQLVQERLHHLREDNNGQKKTSHSMKTTASFSSSSLSEMIDKAKKDISESKTWIQRFISLKSLHGILFFSSWANLAGRIFHSDQSGDFTCHTYPVYKPIDGLAFEGMTIVPEEHPNAQHLPWADMKAWIKMTIINSLLMAVVFCFIYTYFSSRKVVPLCKLDDDVKKATTSKDTSDKHDSEQTTK